jgi:hypothetical protein
LSITDIDASLASIDPVASIGATGGWWRESVWGCQVRSLRVLPSHLTAYNERLPRI